MLLINGVPVVPIKMKTLGISPRRAMQQILDYKNDPGNGYTKTLLCFVPFFIVRNRTDTQYFANNNERHFAFDADERFLPIYRFAAEDNSKIAHLDDFADRFLAKCTLGEMISKYMVLIASEQRLLMMRPYQIYAVTAIVDCVEGVSQTCCKAMRESIPIAARLFMGWKVGNSHSAQTTTLGYTREIGHASDSI